MFRYNPAESTFSGMTRAQLQQALNSAQAALLELQMGKKGVSFSYSQGDGTRSVAFQQTDISSLRMLIRQLQADLGLTRHPRRAIGVRFSG